jgi:predicted RNase H-like HicB family nuclease
LEGGVKMSYKVSVVIEKDDSGYYAYCPELKGCQTQGDTFEEALANIKEAVELYIETLSDYSQKTLHPKIIKRLYEISGPQIEK